MRNIFLLLLFFSNTANGQYISQPTQFDTFINRPSIEWAAYADDTIRFDKVNFNKIIIERFSKKEIKASLPIYRKTEEINHIIFLAKNSLDKLILYPQNAFYILDTYGERTKPYKESAAYKVDTGGTSVTRVVQIIYVHNKKLKSYIAFATPSVIPIRTSSGISLGYMDYFSSCFNFQLNYQAAKTNRILPLSQTRRKINLETFKTEDKLKELYGRNLIETLWPYILDSSITTFSVESNKKLSPKEIVENLVTNERITVPVYDSSGDITSYVIPQIALSPKLFSLIELVQDWYYDYTKNIIFNKIKEAYLYAKKWNNGIQEKEAAPILKIIFN